MSATRTRLSPAARRRQIMDTARALYAERSYEEISLQELADAAGVTRGLLTHYFGEKRGLFLAVMQDSVVMPALPLTGLGGASVEDRARRTMDWIMSATTAYGHAWVNSSGTSTLPGDADVQLIVDAADDRAARLVLDALGVRDSPMLRVRLRSFAPMVKSVCREWLQRETLTREETLDLLTSTLIHLINKDNA